MTTDPLVGLLYLATSRKGRRLYRRADGGMHYGPVEDFSRESSQYEIGRALRAAGAELPRNASSYMQKGWSFAPPFPRTCDYCDRPATVCETADDGTIDGACDDHSPILRASGSDLVKLLGPVLETRMEEREGAEWHSRMRDIFSDVSRSCDAACYRMSIALDTIERQRPILHP
mgnify:CR=1 FL=1